MNLKLRQNSNYVKSTTVNNLHIKSIAKTFKIAEVKINLQCRDSDTTAQRTEEFENICSELSREVNQNQFNSKWWN